MCSIRHAGGRRCEHAGGDQTRRERLQHRRTHIGQRDTTEHLAGCAGNDHRSDMDGSYIVRLRRERSDHRLCAGVYGDHPGGKHSHAHLLRIEQHAPFDGSPSHVDGGDDSGGVHQHCAGSDTDLRDGYGCTRCSIGNDHLAGNSGAVADGDLYESEGDHPFSPRYMAFGRSDYQARTGYRFVAVPDEHSTLLCDHHTEQPVQGIRRRHGNRLVWCDQPVCVRVCNDCDGLEPRHAADRGLQLRCAPVRAHVACL